MTAPLTRSLPSGLPGQPKGQWTDNVPALADKDEMAIEAHRTNCFFMLNSSNG